MRNRYVFLADVVAIGSAAFGAFVLRFDWWFFQYRQEFPVFLAAVLVIKPAVFYGFGLYRRYWRYASVRDLNAVMGACGATAVAASLFVGLALPFGLIQEFSRTVLVIDSLLTLLAAGGVRMSVRVVHEPRVKTRTGRWPFGQKEAAVGKRVLVVGAGNAGTMVVRTRVARPCQTRNAAVATKSPAQAPRDCISSKAPIVRTKVITWMGMRYLPRSRPLDAANNERCEPVTSRATCRGTNKTRQPATAFGLNPASAPGTPRIALGSKAVTESSAGNFEVHWVPSSARTARPAPASRNATVPHFNLSDVVSQRMMAQNNSAPRVTPATLPRLNWTSTVASRLTPTVAKRTHSAVFIAVRGTKLP